jgi:hypothetical protein
MNIKESIKQFLPKYLSETEQKKLVHEISAFPDNLDSRFYTTFLKNELTVFQGDGIEDLEISNLPSTDFLNAKCLVTSNTCDVDPENKRLFESRLTYCPIVDLEKYITNLQSQEIDSEKIENHLRDIKAQKITQILYLPSNSNTKESIVFLDRINNSPTNVITKGNLKKRRIFTLSNYGFYLLLLKLSISFTRIGEGVNRK